MDGRARGYFGVFDAAMGSDGRARADGRATVNFQGAAQIRPGADSDFRADAHGLTGPDDDSGVEVGVHDAPTQDLFGGHQFARAVDAQIRVVAAAPDRQHGQARFLGQGHQVGDVVFAAVVGVGQTIQQGRDGLQAQPVDPGVDLARGLAVNSRIEILGLDNGHALARAHHPAVGSGIRQGDGDKGQISVGGPGRVQERGQAFGRDQRSVAVDHQHVTQPGGGKRRQGAGQGMAGAELFGLQHEPSGQFGKGGFHRLGPMPDHGPDVVAKKGGQRPGHVPQHGFA